MRRLLAWYRRLLGVLVKTTSEREMSAELESHLQLHEDDNLRAGMTPQEARRQAVLALGGIESTKEAIRDRRGIPAAEALLRDIRHAARGLRRDAALTSFAIAIVGIGIGASATVFGVVNALWLRPLPFEDPDRLVWIANGATANLSNQTVQVGHAVDLKEQSRSLAGLAGFSPFYNPGDTRWTGMGDADRVTAVPVTEDFLPLLGVRPWLGRNFVAGECLWGAPRAVILSHAFWQRRLGARMDVIESSITLDGQSATIVGVLPASFDFAGTFSPGRPADLFVPYPLTAENNRRGNTLALIGRLKPHIDIAAAASDTATVVEHIIQTAPEIDPGRRRNAFRPVLTPLRDRISGRFHSILTVLAVAVAVLLLLVAANVSSLLLARASARQKEVALRLALGAGRGRVIRQMVVEGLMLSGAGAAGGLALAYAGTGLIARLQGVAIPLLADVRVDGASIVFVVTVALISGVAFGLLPALQGLELSPQDTLRETSRAVTGHTSLRRAIIVSEIALVCVLLTGAGLLTRSLIGVLNVDPGFSSENVVTLRVDPPRREHPTPAARNAYFEALVQNVRAVPGVAAVGLTDALPLGDNSGWRGWNVEARDRVTDPVVRQSARPRMIDEGYFPAMRVGLKSGRGFDADDRDSSERVVVINEGLARALWADQDPLGRLLRTSNRDYRVVGVVNDVRYFALEQDTGPEMYMLLRQTSDYETVDLVVKSSVPLASLITAIRGAVKRADPGLPATEFRTLEQLVERSVFTRRVVVWLIAGFAGFGLLLASLGLYAVISYSVSQRTREIGVRMALGAAPVTMQKQVLAQTMTLVAIGLAVGLPASWLAATTIRGLLFGVVASDPLTFTGVSVVIVSVAALAGYLPARRASRVDPLLALRSE